MIIQVRAILLIALISVASAAVVGQRMTAANTANGDRRLQSTPAYAEVLLKETEIRSEVESLAAEYTDEHPKLAELRYSLSLLQKEKSRLLANPSSNSDRLTLSLGKLILRKVELDTELWRLQQSLADNHPDVKRARKRVEVFEGAIREILG